MRRITVFTIALFVSLFSVAAFAHPGETDEHGCHKVPSGDDFHCHKDKRTVGQEDSQTMESGEADSKKEDTPLFRGHEWGSSREEILEVEGKPVASEGDTIMFEDTISGMDVYVLFMFHDDAFHTGLYVSTERYANDEKHLRDYHNLQPLLVEKYGQPTETIRARDDNQFTEKKMELLTGSLQFADRWQVGDVEIIHRVWGKNYQVTHMIRYRNQQVSADAEKAKEQEDQNKL